MRFVLVIVLAGLMGLPLSANAQTGESEEAPKQAVEQEPAPSPEPPPGEPALQLHADDVGVDVVPSPPQTFDGYTLEELELRKRRAAFGLIAPAALTVPGVTLLVLGMKGECTNEYGLVDNDLCRRRRTAGIVLTIAGGVGMIIGSILVGVRTQELRLAVHDYTLEEMELRVKRAKVGFGASAGVFLAGVVMGSIYLAKAEPFDFCIFDCPPPPPESVDRVGWAGVALMMGGFVGLITAGAILHGRKRKLRRLQEAHYGGPRRVQWDPVRWRLVF